MNSVLRPAFYNAYRFNDWCGLKDDNKPVASTQGFSLLNGDRFYEIDTDTFWRYDKENDSWYVENAAPQMILNQEYETGEYFLGKKVYAKIIQLNKITATGLTQTPIIFEDEDLDMTISVSGFLTNINNNGNLLSLPYNDGSNSAHISFASQKTPTPDQILINVTVNTSTFVNNYNEGYAIVRYTKIMN